MTDEERRELLARFMEEFILPTMNIKFAETIAKQVQKADDEFFDALPLHEIPMTVRAWNCLTKHSDAYPDRAYRTLGDLRQAKDADLLRVKNFGKKTLKEVRRTIARITGEKYLDAQRMQA